MVGRQPPDGVEGVEDLGPAVSRERCHRPLQLLVRVGRRSDILPVDGAVMVDAKSQHRHEGSKTSPGVLVFSSLLCIASTAPTD